MRLSSLAQRLLGPWGPCTHASSPSSAASRRADLRSLEGDLTARGCPTPSSDGGNFRKFPDCRKTSGKLPPTPSSAGLVHVARMHRAHKTTAKQPTLYGCERCPSHSIAAATIEMRPTPSPTHKRDNPTARNHRRFPYPLGTRACHPEPPRQCSCGRQRVELALLGSDYDTERRCVCVCAQGAGAAAWVVVWHSTRQERRGARPLRLRRLRPSGRLLSAPPIGGDRRWRSDSSERPVTPKPTNVRARMNGELRRTPRPSPPGPSVSGYSERLALTAPLWIIRISRRGCAAVARQRCASGAASSCIGRTPRPRRAPCSHA